MRPASLVEIAAAGLCASLFLSLAAALVDLSGPLALLPLSLALALLLSLAR